jgi:hypothetical protein
MILLFADAVIDTSSAMRKVSAAEDLFMNRVLRVKCHKAKEPLLAAHFVSLKVMITQ